MLQNWLVLSVLALLIWGCWGMFANLTTRHLGGFSALVWEVLGAMIVGGAVLIWVIRKGGLEITMPGAGFGLLTGITYTVGLTLMFVALSYIGSQHGEQSDGGSVQTVIILTALYPVIAVGLNYFVLGDAVSLRQMIGMGVGLLGIAILVSG